MTKVSLLSMLIILNSITWTPGVKAVDNYYKRLAVSIIMAIVLGRIIPEQYKEEFRDFVRFASRTRIIK